ncbi:hypothetical protein [Rubritalea tangerina]|uniref:Uncharacterized protein n=1 Tax=Rubritalea tangerina TaxID=430798 RepID=A0ABW4ZC69_9BACT
MKDRLWIRILVAGGVMTSVSCGIFQFGSSPEYPEVQKEVVAKATEPEEVEARTPVAERVPGRSNYVFNPYTGSVVDVSGIESGKLVRDPADPDMSHVFYVP